MTPSTGSGSGGGSGSCAAILLAGGRASRVGGAAKPLFELGGRTLLQAAVDAARDAGAHPITVAGPVLDETLEVAWVREHPPFGGPVAGIVAALESWTTGHAAGPPADPEWTFLLACDLPRVDAAVARLVADLALQPRDIDGLCLADAGSRPQWLTGVYRTTVLRDAASALPDRGRDAPVRALLADLAIAVVSAPDAARDIDTWEDYREEQTMAEQSPQHLPPEALDAWADALCARFGLARDEVPITLVLDLARDVSKGVARPAAPFSAYVAGLVAGRAGGSPEDVAAAVAAITELAEDWQA